MTTTKTPMPESLSKRIEEMAAKQEHCNIFCQYSNDVFTAGAEAMYQEMQATLSERDAEIERLNDTTSVIRSSMQSKIDFERNQNTRLKSQLKAAQEENEQLMNVEYWPDRYKIEAKKVEELRAFIEEWLAFEESCIKKDGPYVSDRIPKLMKKARETLTKIRGK